ncbi:MAG: hypothetical protein IJH90_05855 [Mogibacterium sp.]|nr:hypothetical protein [Mogibacterium sp.]
MRPISDELRKIISGKSGSEMVEAAVSLPVMILTAMLLIRVFTFYLEILETGISEHMQALDAWDSYSGAPVRTYSDTEDVYLLRGGVLLTDLCKRIDTRSYLINEDMLVRAGDALG